MNIISSAYNLEQLKLKCPAAFSRLYSEYKNKVFRHLFIKSNGDIQTAKDVICDTFYSAIKSVHNLKHASNIQAWLLRIASRRLIDYLKKKNRDKIYFGHYDDEFVYPGLVCNIRDNSPYDNKTFIINKAFSKLKKNYKNIICLKYLEGRSIREISCILNKTHASVSCTLQRARVSLRKEFNKILRDEEEVNTGPL